MICIGPRPAIAWGGRVPQSGAIPPSAPAAHRVPAAHQSASENIEPTFQTQTQGVVHPGRQTSQSASAARHNASDGMELATLSQEVVHPGRRVEIDELRARNTGGEGQENDGPQLAPLSFGR
jgi:hypothetical protein